MTLNNFIKYLEKIGVKQLSQADRFSGFSGIRYRRERWGYNYFFNTEISREGLMLEFNYSEDAANVPELKKAERTIKKYAARYDFMVFFEGFNLRGFWFAIMPANDKKAIDIIAYFVENSLQECELTMHFYHVCGIYDLLFNQLNNTLREIMLRWEAAYNDYIKKHAAGTAENSENIIFFVA